MTLIRQSPSATRATWGREETLTLETGLRELGLRADAGQQAQLRDYGELLLKWNRTYNLLGATSARALVEAHLLDSLAVVPALAGWLENTEEALVDVGTGAGLPGVVLAVMLPDLPIFLVEPVGKKAAFLRQAIAICGLRRAKVLEGRIEDIPPADLHPTRMLPGARRQPAPLHFICRAFTSLERFATLCRPHLQPGSLLFAMKAAKVADELEQLGSSIDVLAVQPLRTVEKDVQRNLVVMRSKEPHPASDPTGPAR